ncbi:MAG TPA: hypothetical protein VIJ22_05500 [Polyangiaceae bacterium]
MMHRAERGHGGGPRLAAVVVLLMATLLVGPAARAGDPFEIQVYDGTANAPGVPGLELHLNDWATGNRGATPPEAPLNGQFHATLEPSLGVTPFWELGAYLQGAVRTDDGVVDWAGVKLRSKFVTPPSWNAHWRLGMNFELAYLPPTYDHDRWGSEIRPIVSWHDDAWLFAFNPILDQSLAGSDASQGPSFQPAVKVARTVGPVALGFEYYATLGPLSAILPWRDEQQQVFEVIDLVSVEKLEVNFGIGEGLTPASEGLVVKAIVGYSFEPSAAPK